MKDMRFCEEKGRYETLKKIPPLPEQAVLGVIVNENMSFL